MSISHVFRLRVSEWCFALMLTSWGLILLRPESTFDLTTSFQLLARVASEETWAWLCAGVGGLRLIALTINGFWTPSYLLRSVTAFLSCFFWSQITLSFFAADSPSTGLAIYPWILLFEIYNVYRAQLDYRIARSELKG